MAVNDRNRKLSAVDIHKYKSPEFVENEVK
jgi:hypothetical protein